MTQRLDYLKQAPELFKALVDLSMKVHDSAIEVTTQHLVTTRASQINGCAFCVDMHVKQATIAGERPLRLHHVAIWRESPLFTERERAALAWTELLTQIPAHGVSDQDYADAREFFDEKELTQLTYLVMSINAWNRVNIAFRTVPGTQDQAYGLTRAQLA
ncbi:carboxymuconolactone decarboxylase family protein [Chitinimonas sp.]|uniref:carboxymuconolactone decarboxylase family protein n=1 Tax=Chitinimonas sp. TaxID=1934313 RepID=UPI002F922889